jgi:hypothetical protein
VAKDAAIPGFDAVQSSGRRVGEYQQGVETSSWKAGAPVKVRDVRGTLPGCLIRPNRKESRRKSGVLHSRISGQATY